MIGKKVLAVIPARYGSTRFEGKPLVDIAGKSMIQRVYEQVMKANVDWVVVATDDVRIEQHVLSFGGKVCMTSAMHPSGTDRCAEVAQQFPSADIVCNIQGDEPLIHPDTINQLISLFDQPQCAIATGYTHFKDAETLWANTTAKLITDTQQKVLAFSRSVIPHLRNVPQEQWMNHYTYKKHVGIYAFLAPVLQEVTQLPLSTLEQAESLEQLRWLENGYSIYATYTPFDSLGVDVPEDVAKIIAKLSV